MKKSGSMTSPKGLYSSKSNPVAPAKMTKPMTGMALGTPANADQAKARKLRTKAYTECDSLRGMNGI
jgi:hypothetical protein